MKQKVIGQIKTEKLIVIVRGIERKKLILLAVGGIDLDNIPLYKKSGVCGFGIGSNIADKEMVANEDWQGVTELAKKYVAIVKGE